MSEICIEKVSVTTTGSAGAATGSGNTAVMHGYLLDVYLDYHASAPGATTDVAITYSAPAFGTLVTNSDSVTDVLLTPRVQACDSTATAISGVYEMYPLNGRLTVTVSQSNALTDCVVAYVRYLNGVLKPIVFEWVETGNPEMPIAILQAPMIAYAATDALQRFCPTRELDRYFELGPPYVKIGGVWTQIDLGLPEIAGQQLTWTKPQANVYIQFGGHFMKLAILLKGGWVPENNQIAFPVSLTGLTREGLTVYADGSPVMYFQPLIVYDYDNPDDVRVIDQQIVQFGGQWYVLLTLPDLSGMSRPLVDPTLTLQPDATAGEDTYIYEGLPGNSYGVATLFATGTTATPHILRSLLAFDLSSISSGSTASSATLTLYCESEANAADENVGAHRALTEWYEGDGNGAAPSGDGSTWTHRNHNGSVAWSGGAGGGSGSDYAATAVATTAITAATASYNWNVLTDVQLFIDGTANHGWWMVNTDEANASTSKKFTSSDGATAANRPKLVTVYTLPGGGSQLSRLIQSGAINR
jgi:hypothetical protein